MQKVSVLGGSGISTPWLARSLFETLGANVKLVLIGRDIDKLSCVYEVCKHLAPELQVTWTSSIEEGVEGASVIVNQIRVGGLEGRAWDEKAPTEVGLIGDESVGAGGFSLGFRSAPVIRKIGHTIENYAPSAWVVNLTNPAGLILSVLNSETSIKAVSLCDMPVIIMNSLNAFYPDQVKDYRFFGTNHASWLIAASNARGDDVLTEIIDQLPPEFSPIELSLLKLFGAIPSPYLRYVYERQKYTPSKPLEVTRAKALLVMQDEMLDAFKKHDFANAKELLSKRNPHWYDEIVVPVVTALLNEQHKGRYVVQIPNNGLVPFLRSSAAVEVLAEVSPDGIHPLPIADIPSEVKSLTLQITESDELSRLASWSNDSQLATRALLQNPFVSDYHKAREFWSLYSKRWLQ